LDYRWKNWWSKKCGSWYSWRRRSNTRN